MGCNNINNYYIRRGCVQQVTANNSRRIASEKSERWAGMTRGVVIRLRVRVTLFTLLGFLSECGYLHARTFIQ